MSRRRSQRVTPERLEAIGKRVSGASPGPWGALDGLLHRNYTAIWDGHGGELPNDGDLDFLTHSRADVEDLREEVLYLQRELGEIGVYLGELADDAIRRRSIPGKLREIKLWIADEAS